jgi:hypothetical protein
MGVARSHRMRLCLLSLLAALLLAQPVVVQAAPAAAATLGRTGKVAVVRNQGRRGVFRRIGRRAGALKKRVGRGLKQMRSGLSSLWKRGAAGAESKERPADEIRILRMKIRPRTMGDWSTLSLLAAGANEALMVGSKLGPISGPLTGVGAIGLGVYSVHGLINAKSSEKRLDAAHGIAWSLQGMTGLVRLGAKRISWLGTGSMQRAGTVLGVGGGLLQAGLGGYRLLTGIKRRERRRIVLGGLDVGAGLCWAASACAIGGPWALGGFIGLTAVRMGYYYKDKLATSGGKLLNATRRLFGLKPRKSKSDRKGPKVIVTKPTSEAVAARAAQTPGVTTIESPDGKKAVVTGATVQSNDGQKHQAVVVTPVE